MKLVVFSHKRCWTSSASPSGFASHGGFPIQMHTLSQLFDTTTLVLPHGPAPSHEGELPLTGRNLQVAPLTYLADNGLWRRLRFPLWLARNFPVFVKETVAADAVHTPIPSDIGTIGMVLATLLRKPLIVRHCGNWFKPVTTAQRFWKWFMEHYAGGRNVMFATGGDAAPPSSQNSYIRWIFSTSLTDSELRELALTDSRCNRGAERLITVCRQERYKGTGIVIESLQLIRQHFPKASLDVVGDGTALDEFRQLASDLDVTDHVRFHGKVNHDRVLDLLQAADLFCYPTTASEGFPKVVLEALACGLPVITTPVSVLPALMKRGCGHLVEEASPRAVADAVIEILADTGTRRQMSCRAREVAAQYSLERWRDTIGTALREQWGPLRNDDRVTRS